MKNIKVIVDLIGSANVNEINKHLTNMKNDSTLVNDNVAVFLFTDTTYLQKDLKNLDLPLTPQNVLGHPRRISDKMNGIINEAVGINVDSLVYIGNFMGEEIKKESIRNPNTNIVFVCTEKEPNVKFIEDLKNLPNIKVSTTSQYISLNTLFNNLSIEDKLAKVRSTSNGNDSKLKP